MSIPPFANAASLQTIPSLGSVLRSQGWQLISAIPMNMSSASQATPIVIYNSAAYTGVSGMINENSPVSVPAVKLVYANYFGNAAPNYELQANNDIQVAASVSAHSSTAECYPATFSGQLLTTVKSRAGITISDTIQFPVTANTTYDVITFAGVTSPANQTVPRTYAVGGGSSGHNPTATDGSQGEDCTTANKTSISHSSSIAPYGPVAILGYTGINIKPTLGLLGDSIQAGTGDGGGVYGGAVEGWGMRIAHGGVAQSNVYVPLPLTSSAYGAMFCARGAGTLAAFVLPGQNRCIYEQLSLASTVICNLATNDLGSSSLATIQANILTIATNIANQGSKFIQATILPHTTSTDNWTTTANQTDTTGGAGGIRALLNTWLRNTSASGFVQQAAAQSGLSASMFAMFDAAAAVEVNSSGVLTLNGGLWIPPQTSSIYSGTVTTSATGAAWSDSALGAIITTNQYTGYSVAWQAGSANAGFNTVFSAMLTTTGAVITTGNNSTPLVNDAYKIYLDLPTIDGTHPTSHSHLLIAASFPASLLV